MKKRTFIEIIASLFVLLFVYTALSKLFLPEKFKWALGKSPLISSYKDIIVWAIPSVELALALLLFFPKTRRWGLLSSFILMSIFTVYISYMMLFTPKLPCSCGGIIQYMTWKQHLVFNILFTALAGWAYSLYRTKDKALETHQAHPGMEAA
jgi:putative oxidoreductase